MLCAQILRGNVKCNSPLLPVYVPGNGWFLCCSKCHNEPIIPKHPIDISDSIGQDIMDAFAYYDDGRFEDATSKFAQIESRVGSSKWKTACSWHRLLSQYGFVYDEDDISWTICRPELEERKLKDFSRDRNMVLDTIPSSDSEIKQSLIEQLDYFKRTIDAILANRDHYDVFIDWDIQSSSSWAKELADKIKAALVEDNIRAYTGERNRDDHECGNRYAKGLATQLMLAIVESLGITENTRFFHEAQVFVKRDSTRIIYCFHKKAQNREDLPGFMKNVSTDLMFDETNDDLDIFAHNVASKVTEKLASYKSVSVHPERISNNNEDHVNIDYDEMYRVMYQELNDYCSSYGVKPDEEWFNRLYQMWNDSSNPKIGVLILLYLYLPKTDYSEGRKFYQLLAQMFPAVEEVQKVLNNPAIKATLVV